MRFSRVIARGPRWGVGAAKGRWQLGPSHRCPEAAIGFARIAPVREGPGVARAAPPGLPNPAPDQRRLYLMNGVTTPMRS